MSEHTRTASQEIDNIIKMYIDWRGIKLKELRSIITAADPSIIEDVKWKKPSKPEGVPVWSYSGIVCVADTLKNAVRLTFPKGARLNDPHKIFNTRLDSKTVRAVDFTQDDKIDSQALTNLVLDARSVNMSKNKSDT